MKKLSINYSTTDEWNRTKQTATSFFIFTEDAAKKNPDIMHRAVVAGNFPYALYFSHKPSTDDMLHLCGYIGNGEAYDSATDQRWFDMRLRDLRKQYDTENDQSLEERLEHPKWYVWYYRQRDAFGHPLNIRKIFLYEFVPMILSWLVLTPDFVRVRNVFFDEAGFLQER